MSIQEWTKHQAISGWSLEGSGSNFRFAFKSHQCPDPVTHKTILDFVAKIDAEIHAVREEVHWQSRSLPDAQRDHYRLDLPHKVEADVNPKGHPYHPIYIYHDLQFRLDQDEIQKLLMGTALYGDPGLCIRELLQNALDALELRKLRLKMLEETDETPREKVDRLRRGEELQVTLTWGRDPKTEQEYIQRHRQRRRHDQEGHPGLFHPGRQELLQERRLPPGAGSAGQRRLHHVADLALWDRHPLLFHDCRAAGSPYPPWRSR